MILLGTILMGFSCIDQFTPELDRDDFLPLLVVDGQITDQIGPFCVKLTYSSPVQPSLEEFLEIKPYTNADVKISDDAGNDYILTEVDDGWYETQNKELQGIPGNTYILSIIGRLGTEYESEPVLMHESPEIDSVYFEENKRINFGGIEPFEENLIIILVDSKAPKEEGLYLRWEFEETWKFEMPTYILVDNGFQAKPTRETIDIDLERKICWVTEPSRAILIESTNFYTNQCVNRFKLTTIGPESDRLNIKYSILVKQFAIEWGLYNMFKKLREVNIESEGVFSKIPGQVYGNMTCCNGDSKVLGYFLASGVKTKRIFIDRFEHNVEKGSAYSECGWTTVPPPYTRCYFYGYGAGEVCSTEMYCTDCRMRGTNVKPDFWEE